MSENSLEVFSTVDGSLCWLKVRIKVVSITLKCGIMNVIFLAIFHAEIVMFTQKKKFILCKISKYNIRLTKLSGSDHPM